MTADSNVPLTPAELFRRGIEITQEIRGRIVEARAYYLGRSSREPEQEHTICIAAIRGRPVEAWVPVCDLNETSPRAICHLDATKSSPAGQQPPCNALIQPNGSQTDS